MNTAEDKKIIITGAGIKDEMFCHYGYTRAVAPGITDKCNIKSQLPVHDDMKVAFRKLNNHLAAICEEVTAEEMKDADRVIFCPPGTDLFDFESGLQGLDKKLFGFVVTGFKIDGQGENAGVTLEGKKKLSTGEWLGLVTPKVKWEDNYYFINELRISIDDLIAEIEAYMEGKQAPRMVQTEIDFDNPTLTDSINALADMAVSVSVNGGEFKKINHRGRKPKEEIAE